MSWGMYLVGIMAATCVVWAWLWVMDKEGR